MPEDIDNIIDSIPDDGLQDTIDRILGHQSFDFFGYVRQLVDGSGEYSAEEIIGYINRGFQESFAQNGSIYIHLILVAVVGAIISNFSRLLQGRQVSETAFYAVYLVFFVTLTTGFSGMLSVGIDTLENLFDFMKILSPSYFMCLGFSKGALAGKVFYEFTLVVITIADMVFLKFALPGIRLYFWLSMADKLAGEDMFSKYAKLVKDIVMLVMKTMFGTVMGINVVQGLVVPATAEAQNTLIVKAGSMLPGIGNSISTLVSTLLCAGKLVKNAVGVAGIIVMLVICIYPFIKIILGKFLYQLVGALIQPISDKRITGCFTAMEEALKMLVYALGAACMMFALSIAIICAI